MHTIDQQYIERNAAYYDEFADMDRMYGSRIEVVHGRNWDDSMLNAVLMAGALLTGKEEG